MDKVYTTSQYRGYRLWEFASGDVAIFYGPDHIDTCGSKEHAKGQIDEWMEAR